MAITIGKNKAAETAKEISQKLDILEVNLHDKSTRGIFQKLLDRPLSMMYAQQVKENAQVKELKNSNKIIASNTTAILNIHRELLKIIRIWSKTSNKDTAKALDAQKAVANQIKKSNHAKLKAKGLKLPKETIKTLAATQEKSMGKAMINAQKKAAKDNKSKLFQESLTTKPAGKLGLPKDKKDDKSEKKSKFSLSALAKGFLKLLKAMLNPMALIMAFISKFLPYILIFGAMLYGAWCGLGQELRDSIIEKATWVLDNILKPAVALFLTWKAAGVVFRGIIKALNFAFHLLRMVFLRQEHTKAMAQLDKEMVFSTIEHGQKQAATFKDIILRIVEFVLKQAAAIIDMILRGIEFAIKIAAVAIVVVLVGLAIGILILALAKIFIYLAGLVLDLIGKAFEVLMPIAEFMIDSLLKVGTAIFEGIALVITTFFMMLIAVLAVSGFIGGLFGGGKKETNKVEMTNGVTESIFTEQLSRIIEPLNILTKQMTTLIAIETASLTFNPYMLITSMAFKGVSSVINRSNISANDSTQSNITNTKNVSNNNNDELLKETNNLLKIINENVYIIAENQGAAVRSSSMKNPIRS